MTLKCVCGTYLSDTGSPNFTECLLLNSYTLEKLQDLVDGEVARDGTINEWPEHWEDSGAIELWMCYQCKRLYVQPKDAPEKIVVYAIEKVGHP